MTTPPLTQKWVPVWPLTDPEPQIPTPVNGKWLKGGPSGAMTWEDLPPPPAGIVTPSSDWIILSPLLNGWIQYNDPYGPIRYRKLASGLVVMEGLMHSGSVSVAAFNLPVGFRPTPQVGGGTRNHIFNTAVGGGVTAESIRIDSDGVAVVTSNNAPPWIALNGVTFYAG